eukprot:jgi/Hompol1/6359/HPOL_002109-RA
MSTASGSGSGSVGGPSAGARRMNETGLVGARRIAEVNPVLFHQKIVHSDGSTFTLRSTSPRSVLQMTRDTRNHQLWNPSSLSVDDLGGELRKFAERFSDIGDLGALEGEIAIDSAPAAAPAPAAKQTAAAAGSQEGKKKKK